MLLNVGCGEHPVAGWANLDLHRDGPSPDVLGSILALPFPDRSCERVFLGHVLEHVVTADLPRALGEVRRVLAPGGSVLIVGPDIDLTRVHEPVLLDAVRHGGCRWPGDEHRWESTGARTLECVLAAGLSGGLVALDGLEAVWPVVDRLARWQFAILAANRREDAP